MIGEAESAQNSFNCEKQKKHEKTGCSIVVGIALAYRQAYDFVMAQFHFVEDYRKFVDDLVAKHPIDDAMSLAVGGSYEKIGRMCSDIAHHFGLDPDMEVLDFGCGSGRTATAIPSVARYVGIDVVPALLEYADARTSANFEFHCNTDLTIPLPDNSFDFVIAFSVFTHLLQPEIFLYLSEMKRVLRKDRKIVFSFLEFAAPAHWAVFESTLDQTRASHAPHLNMFIERGQIEAWAARLGLRVVSYLDGSDAVSDQGSLGQSCVVLST